MSKVTVNDDDLSIVHQLAQQSGAWEDEHVNHGRAVRAMDNIAAALNAADVARHSSVAGLASLRAGHPSFNEEPTPLTPHLIDAATGKDMGPATPEHVAAANSAPFGHVYVDPQTLAIWHGGAQWDFGVACWIDSGEPF